MGHFATNTATMQKAVNDILTAKTAVDTQINTIGLTSEGTLKSWVGEGGNTLRALMVRYDSSAKALQKAVDTIQTMVGEQAKTYGVTDADTSSALSSAGGGLQM
jgi:uncharacterized protein YukE